MGNNCYPIKLLLVIITLGFAGCTDLDDNLDVARAQDVITKDSELFQLLERVTIVTDDPLQDVVCIDFIYPVNVKLYDENLIGIGSVTVWSDDEFSQFLGAISPTQALSISYPISTTLADGSVFSVNNNSELKLAIDNCSREDIISYCGSVFNSGLSTDGSPDCIWRVDYGENYDNKYVGGVFQINPDNSLVFIYGGEDYPGNWIFEFVDNQLHININLEGTSEVAAYWNIDRRMAIWEDTINIATEPKHILLKRHCQDSEAYELGDAGPAGGIVFFDKGAYSNGWRYMEAAPLDLGLFEWGCASSEIGSTADELGTGLANSGLVTSYHDLLDNYYGNPSVCNATNNGTVASQKALIYEWNGFDDWFLPSYVELGLMHANLHLLGLGNFANTTYWSSTEVDTGNAQTINFTDGSATTSSKIPSTNTVQARAIRYF